MVSCLVLLETLLPVDSQRVWTDRRRLTAPCTCVLCYGYDMVVVVVGIYEVLNIRGDYALQCGETVQPTAD